MAEKFDSADLIPIENLIATYENNKSEKNKTSLEVGVSHWRQVYNVRMMATMEADSEATTGEL